MKIFWSWQSDTPGKVGRHFVRDALRLAIEALKQAPDVEEPTAAETRESIHLDHDRQSAQQAAPFQEQPSVETSAYYFAAGEVLGRSGVGTVDEIEYRFAEPRAFYLRLMPTTAQREVKQTQLMDIAGTHRPDVLSQYRMAACLDRNGHGVIGFNPSGTAATPTEITQLFTTGEIWGVTRGFFASYRGMTVIPTVALENIYRRVLANYVEILEKGFGIAPPYTVVFGGIGLRDAHVGLNGGVDGPIYNDRIEIRRILNETNLPAQGAVVQEFVEAVLDFAGVRRA